jgi:hypothetical protein
MNEIQIYMPYTDYFPGADCVYNDFMNLRDCVRGFYE